MCCCDFWTVPLPAGSCCSRFCVHTQLLLDVAENWSVTTYLAGLYSESKEMIDYDTGQANKQGRDTLGQSTRDQLSA